MFWRKRHPLVNRMFHVLLEKKFKSAVIGDMFRKEDVLIMYLKLPPQKSVADLMKILSNLKEEAKALDVKIGQQEGKYIEIIFGMRKLGDENSPILYTNDLFIKNELKLKFPSAFGWKVVDFWSESFWHCLLGGATGMGKSNLLYYILTQLFLNMDGKMDVYISSSKVRTDFYMFDNIPQISLAETIDETGGMLGNVLDEAYKRKALLEKYKVRDVKALRKKTGMEIPPVFVVIDEYAEIADEEDLQNDISHIVRVCRYLDFHLIACTQRPSATEAIPSQVRGNLLGNIALACRDEHNSKLIIGSDEAAQNKLGKIKGRAVILDGFTEIIQVPFLEESQIEKLLDPYRSVNDEPKRSEDPEISEAVSSIKQEPTGEIVFFDQQKSSSSSKSSHEEAKTRRKNHKRSKTERSIIPIYAKPNYDPPPNNKD